MPRRLQLEGTSLADLEAQVLFEHGSAARVIAVEKVTVGGIRGFFARRHYELTIELPDPPASSEVAAAGSTTASAGAIELVERMRPVDAILDLPARVGIAALLSDAEQAEAELNLAVRVDVPATAPVAAPATPRVSTGSERFARLLDDLAANTAPSSTPSVVLPPGSRPLRGPGDLVLVVGLGDDALIAARSMAAASGTSRVSVAGALKVAGADRIDGRQSALAARARGVKGGHSVFVAVGLGADWGSDGEGPGCAGVLGSVGADQVWAAVDAQCSAEGTAVWVNAVSAVVRVDAVAVVGS